MRVLITGGFGFVGGRLAAHLVQHGYKVILGSRTLRGVPDWLPSAEVMQTDWTDQCSLEKNCIGVDVVIQAAGMNAQACAADPIAALAFNGLATSRLVTAASRMGVQQFIYLSTAHVYSDVFVEGLSDQIHPCNQHPYATSHLAGENAVLSANQTKLMRGTVLRLSNAYGYPMHQSVNCWTLLANDLCRQAVEKGDLFLQTSGLQHRNFIGLAEVCNSVMHHMDPEKLSNKKGVFNIGSRRTQSVLEMAKFIQKRCEKILGFRPPLHRQGTGKVSSYNNINPTNQLTDSILCTNEFLDSKEIDGLLRFCLSKFIKQKIGKI